MKPLFAPQNSYTRPSDEPEEIICIEYHKRGKQWLPFNVLTPVSQYDFEHCVLGQLAHHESGGGSFCSDYSFSSFCAAPKICARLWFNREKFKPHKYLPGTNGKSVLATDDDLRAMGYQIIPEPLALVKGIFNPFEHPDALDSDTEYCSECEGRHPTESICRHIHFEEGCGFYLGCGAPEVDFGKAQASLYRLLRMLPTSTVENLRIILGSKDYSAGRFSDSMLGGDCNWDVHGGRQTVNIYCEPLGDELNYEDRFWPGIAWLQSLSRKTKEARALTLGWVWAFQRTAWRACCVVPEHNFIRRLPDKELDEWLALDPLDPTLLHERPLIVPLNFKSECANDCTFLEKPKSCHEVILWPKRNIGYRSITLSVAEVKLRREKRERIPRAHIYFGAVIEHKGQHVSKLAGYRLTYR